MKKYKVLLLLLIIINTYAYSALSTNLSMTGEANIRAVSDIRVTNIELNQAQNEAKLSYDSRYTKNTITSGFELPNNNSQISYNVTIKNQGTIDQAIYDFQTQSCNNNDMTILIDDNPINETIPLVIPFGTTKTIKITYKTNNPGNNVINIINKFIFKEVYYVEYDSRGGTNVSTQIKYKDVDLVLEGTPTKENSEFIGWADDDESTTVQYIEGDTYTLNEDLTLYALYNQGDSTFLQGDTFNIKIKTLANPLLNNISASTNDTNITSIQRVNSVPQTWINDDDIIPPSSDNIVSTSNSENPIYAWYDNGTIYYYTSVGHPYMNANAHSMFRGLNNVTLIDLSTINTNKTTNISSMFNNCYSLSSLNLSNFDTSKVEYMNSTFDNCRSLTTLNLSSFDTNKVEDMNYMIANCNNLESITFGNNFDTSSVTSMVGMFHNSSSLESLDLSSFDMTNVSDTTNMLSNTTSLKSIKTPEKYSTDSEVLITLPNTMYDPDNNSYSTLKTGDPLKTWIKRPYTVIYNANGGTGTMNNQMIGVDATTKLSENTFTKENNIFVKWNTQPDGSGTSYLNKASVSNLANYGGTVNLYAQWTTNGVAMIGNKIYTSITNAIKAVSTDGTPTEIVVLKSVSENIEIKSGQNVTLNLQNFTLSNKGSANVVKNYGTLTLINGTISTSVAQGAINNYNRLIVTGGRIEATATTTKQAIWNDGGDVEISGDAYLSSASTSRATVHNKKGDSTNIPGTVTITGGTIVSSGLYAIQNDAGTVTIGTKDGASNKTSPDIQGNTQGINISSANDAVLNFYDGVIKGKTVTIADLDNLIAKEGAFDKEEHYDLSETTVSIGGVNYKALTLAHTAKIRFDANGGTVSPLEKTIEFGGMIGELPTPTRENYVFDGWFDENDNEVTETTIVEDDLDLTAQWIAASEYFVASIGQTQYHSIAEAITAVPSGTQTTITLIRNTKELITIPSGKNIILAGENYTLSNINNTATNSPVITNSGRLTIVSGTYKSASETTAVINNTGTLYITGGNVIAVGQRQAVYNNGGTLEISGTAYLSATTPVRGTIHNQKGDKSGRQGTTTIKGGTIISYNYSAVYNDEGIVTIGEKDSIINITSPVLQGAIYAVDVNSEKATTFNLYDGIFKGVTDSLNSPITDQEDDTQLETTQEEIDSVTYIVTYLKNTE